MTIYCFLADEIYSDDDGNLIQTPFDNIPQGFWWAIVTILTVGYGDIVPISIPGKFIAGLCMLIGTRHGSSQWLLEET